MEARIFHSQFWKNYWSPYHTPFSTPTETATKYMYVCSKSPATDPLINLVLHFIILKIKVCIKFWCGKWMWRLLRSNSFNTHCGTKLRRYCFYPQYLPLNRLFGALYLMTLTRRISVSLYCQLINLEVGRFHLILALMCSPSQFVILFYTYFHHFHWIHSASIQKLLILVWSV